MQKAYAGKQNGAKKREQAVNLHLGLCPWIEGLALRTKRLKNTRKRGGHDAWEKGSFEKTPAGATTTVAAEGEAFSGLDFLDGAFKTCKNHTTTCISSWLYAAVSDEAVSGTMRREQKAGRDWPQQCRRRCRGFGGGLPVRTFPGAGTASFSKQL